MLKNSLKNSCVNLLTTCCIYGILDTQGDSTKQTPKHTNGETKMSDRINEAIKNASETGTHIADAVHIGKDENGYWVTDNGEEINGLSAEDAARIAKENLDE